MFGLTYTVKMEAGWTLQRADNSTVVWQESIKSEHTATFQRRLPSSNAAEISLTEGAARDNIAKGLQKYHNLNYRAVCRRPQEFYKKFFDAVGEGDKGIGW